MLTVRHAAAGHPLSRTRLIARRSFFRARATSRPLAEAIANYGLRASPQGAAGDALVPKP